MEDTGYFQITFSCGKSRKNLIVAECDNYLNIFEWNFLKLPDRPAHFTLGELCLIA